MMFAASALVLMLPCQRPAAVFIAPVPVRGVTACAGLVWKLCNDLFVFVDVLTLAPTKQINQ
jgi:hypothetical protein